MIERNVHSTPKKNNPNNLLDKNLKADENVTYKPKKPPKPN